MHGVDRVVVKVLHTICTLQASHSLYLAVPSSLETSRAQQSALIEMLTHRNGLSEKQKRLNSMSLPLFKACNSVLAQIEEQYVVSKLHIHVAGKKLTAQLDGLLTVEGLVVVVKRRKYNAADTVFPFIPAFVGRVHGSVESCN